MNSRQKKMNRKSFINPFRVLIMIAFTMDIVTAAQISSEQLTQKAALNFTVLHNNDMHARFEQTDQYTSNCDPNEMIANKCYGGFARVSHVLKQYRNKSESGGPAVLYLNAGDTYTGTPWFAIYKDRIVTEFMNVLKPDAIVSVQCVKPLT